MVGSMITSNERPHVYYDVDYTLVRPVQSDKNHIVDINGVPWEVNHNLIEEIHLSVSRGHVVIVWSQGGADWAKRVVQALGLEELVDFCLAKPSWFADDKPHEEILDKTRQFFRDF